MPAPSMTSQEGMQPSQLSSASQQQQLAKSVASKQQKLLRNQIFKSSDFTNNGKAAASGAINTFNVAGGSGNSTQHFDPSKHQL